VRSLGFIFLIPFVIFVAKKQIDFYLIKRLGIVILLTILTASAGWIMVQSGLVNRPWVNAYKLAIHFTLAVLVIWAMVKTVSDVYLFGSKSNIPSKKIVSYVMVIAFAQMIVAGIMAGMKAGLYYPSWPDMNGEFVPGVLLNPSNWHWYNMINYDSYLFAPALIQFTHRMLAYILVAATMYLFFKLRNEVEEASKKWLNGTLILVWVQIILGILTVLNVEGKIPLFFGVSHQLIGLLYFMGLLFLYDSLRKQKA
jgi:cytochrome c oxidase assembly protein subunit 15